MRALVALIGRPNVGKSTLFNRMVLRDPLAPKSWAITEKTPGVTRDRNYGRSEWDDRHFSVVDTGGFYTAEHSREDDEMTQQVKEQALAAIEDADVIVHLLDGKEGLMPADAEIARFLRSSGRRVVWAVNKIDIPRHEERLAEFHRLGVEPLLPLSAISGFGFDELMDAIVERLPVEKSDRDEGPHTEEMPRVAVVGRPNVGKSTIINALLSKQRHVVSAVPGTTRDPIDSVCTYYGKRYLFIDTAGIRRKVESHTIEQFSVLRAVRSIERADIALIVMDASVGIVEQDQRIAGIVEEAGRSGIVLFNKWDLVQDHEERYRELRDDLARKIWLMDYAPCLSISGLQRTRLTKVYPLIDKVLAERNRRIPTAELNRFLADFNARRPLKTYRGREVKILYMTQVGVAPPVFTVFVNYPQAFGRPQARVLEKALRDTYAFTGTPLRLHFRHR
jgi:GTP-binding protein